ncbi:MAG: alanine racemase [Acetivibrionales bacterium]|jgi:alanine racemase
MINFDRVVAEVDLDAIMHNYRQIKKRVGSGSEIIPVVKADAYGHGAVEVSLALMECSAPGFAVAIVEEAVQLRQAGINIPILVLGHTPEKCLEDIVKYDITQTVFTYEMAANLSKWAVSCGRKARIHIKLDTGMGRIGFFPDREAAECIRAINGLPNIEIAAMYTHFPSADEKDKSFTLNQIKKLADFRKALEGENIHIPRIHAANSACILDIEEGFLDFVRPGLLLYGLYPANEGAKSKLPLKPAMSLKSRIVFIKEMEAGMPISYGRRFYTSRKSRIATVPVGYADGYSRSLSPGGRVIVGESYAPIVGTICMDQFMVDITDIPGVKTGDEVILMGRKGSLGITAEDLAQIRGTINYEVVCGIGKRVPRVYIRNGQPI